MNETNTQARLDMCPIYYILVYTGLVYTRLWRAAIVFCTCLLQSLTKAASEPSRIQSR